MTLGFSVYPVGVTGGANTESTVTIVDDEGPAVSVSFEQGSYTVAEGSSVMVKMTLSADPERTVAIPITKAEQDGASSQDYSGVPASVTFNSGDTEKTITFAATQDTQDDDGENVKLEFGSLPGGVSEGTNDETVVNITDDDNPRIAVSFEQATYTVAESADTSTTEVKENEVTVKVVLSADPERRFILNLFRNHQDGATPQDYEFEPDCFCVYFDSGDTEESITFTAVNEHRG